MEEIQNGSIVMYYDEPYYFEENETHTILTSVNKSKHGRYTVLHFIKDEEKGNEVLERVGRMIVRAIARGDI